MTYRPGDTLKRKITLLEEGVTVTATVERNDETESGTGITSAVTGKICVVTMAIPAEWLPGDFISITLTATLDDETSYFVLEFQLESQTLSQAATLAKQEEILTAIGNIESGAIPAETVAQVNFIHGKFTYIPPDRGAIALPAASKPNMVKIAVFLSSGPDLHNGEEVTVTMYEKGNVYIDGSYQVKRQFTGTSGTFTDENNVVYEGVAVIDVFDSEKLESAGYNGLYEVIATGLKRDLWVLPDGGDIGEMPETKTEV